MNIAHPVPSTVQSISFSFLTSEDVRKTSVKQIVNPVLLDDLNRPNVGGLYDPALGPSDRRDLCGTCRLSYFACPGHFGHIELPSPIFHPLFMINMFKLLKGMCFYCHRFKMSRLVMIKYIARLRLLDHGLLDAANALDEMEIRKTKVTDENGENGDAETAYEESLQDFEKRINLFVLLAIRAHPDSGRDSYKDMLVFETRKTVINEFLRLTALKKCMNGNCRAHSHSLRKEGHTKIVELDLSRKQKNQHTLLGLKRRNILHLERLAQERGQQKQSERENIDMDENFGSTSGGSEDEDEETFPPDDEPTVPEREIEHLPKTASGRVKTMRGRNERVMVPEECRAHLRRLFANERIICSLIYGRHGPFAPVSLGQLSFASADIFFIECMLVSPTRFRPPAKLGDQLFEHPQNELLTKVLTTSYRLRDLNRELFEATEKESVVDEALRKRTMSSLLGTLIQLQVDVNSFIDSSKNPMRVRQGQLPPPGIKQLLEKKEGLFRMHMMGKRVNYAARSVISPDVNIEPNEIGIPPIFARKLTFPEPVTDHNVHLMRELIINGPHKYPGATIVEFEDGKQRSLERIPIEDRRALANQLLTPQNEDVTRTALQTKTPTINKKVYRHLRDGDVLILNRQPTLHKPSMMAHKAKVLQGEKTIRMHYANCNSYNADFDGDEMNIHFPQNEVARSEAMYIANTDNQYLVPTSGKPLRGLIQDHVVAGVWMTNRETFFTRDEYFQLLYGALRPEESAYLGERLRTLPPTIWKPKALWTGKQIISTILLNITPKSARGLNLISKSKVPGDLWGKGSEEGKVIFLNGELICGVLDKAQFGASDYGLVHAVYEAYGPDISGKLLGILSRLFTKFLQYRAFTCRIDDLTLTCDGESERKAALQEGRNYGTEAALENFPSLASVPPAERGRNLRAFLQEVLRDDAKMAGLDMTVKKKLAGLTRKVANACMPHGLQRQFPHNHMQMMTQAGAKGSAVNAQQISCVLGQQELEGRRVPVMVSGKTLPSFKSFETAAIAGGYVASRFLTGVKPQEFYFHCMAGREGLIDTAVKTSRTGYLQRCLIKHLEGIRVHYDNTVRGSDSSVYQFHYGGDALDVTKQKYLYQFEFAARNEWSLLSRYKPADVAHLFDDDEAMRHMKKAIKHLRDPSKGNPLPPAMSLYSPSLHLGATSEKFAQKVDEYIRTNPDNLLKAKGSGAKGRNLIPHARFRTLMNVIYMRSLADPGEAVGLLASQGIGEPSTQMTLNTFHFAGHGAANVTLGIPRLREIVMTASVKPKTPSMTFIVCPGAAELDVQNFCKRASRLSLSQIIERVKVNERLGQARERTFFINIEFYPLSECKSEYDVEPSEILLVFRARFPLLLKREIQLELKKLNADIKAFAEVGQGKAESRAEPGQFVDEDADVVRANNDDASEIGDGDADDEKQARQTKEHTSYESDEDEETEPQGDQADQDDLEAGFADDKSDKDTNEADEDGQMSAGKPVRLGAEISHVRKGFFDNLKNANRFEFSGNGACFELQFEPGSPKLLLVGLIEKACQKTIIREISGISNCFLSKDEGKDKQLKLVTNGVNYRGMWTAAHSLDEPVVQLNNVYANDIYAGLITYGVEMARAVIIKEIQSVFSAYSIDVNIRHLELIADYMTFEGGYKPFNRKGISTNSSPLLKASYETTATFISEATLYGDYDNLTTPSGNIVLGRPSHTGTGGFDIIHALQH